MASGLVRRAMFRLHCMFARGHYSAHQQAFSISQKGHPTSPISAVVSGLTIIPLP